MVKFTKEIVEFIRLNATGLKTDELTVLINKHFNASFTCSQIKNCKSRYHITSGVKTCFVKGNTPHNKGKKQSDFMSDEAINRTKATRFKKGNIPHNHRLVGSERITKDGYTEIKVAEPNKWKLKHVMIWEQVNGEKPKSSVVIFLDGNKQNFDIENLKLIKRAQLAVMCKNGMFSDNAEITDANSNIAKLITVRSKKQKELINNG